MLYMTTVHEWHAVNEPECKIYHGALQYWEQLRIRCVLLGTGGFAQPIHVMKGMVFEPFWSENGYRF